MKFTTFLILSLFITNAFAAGVEQKWPTDTATMGVGGSAASKVFTFDTALGASNPKITIPMATKDFNFNKAVKIAANLLRVGDGANVITKVIEFDIGSGALNPKMNFNAVSGTYEFENGTINAKGNLISLGDGTNSTKTIKFNKGANSPEIRYNAVSSKIEFSNDSVVYKAIGSGAGGGVGINLLDNKGFEDGISVGWTNVGGTYALAVAPNILFENVSAAFTATLAGQYFETSSYVVPKILHGERCYAKIQYAGGDANSYLTVMDGASLEIIPTSARAFLNASIGTKTVKTYFDCPSSGSIKFRIISTAAMAIAFFDEAALGTADLVPTKQAIFIGDVFYPTGIGNVNVASLGYIDALIANTGTYTNLIAPTGNRIGFRIPSAAKGRYVIIGTGFEVFAGGGAPTNSGGIVSFASSDIPATQSCGLISTQGNVASQSDVRGGGAIVCEYNNTSDQLNKEFWIKFKATVNNGNLFTAEGSRISVYFYPSGTDTVVNSKCINDIACENTFSASISTGGIVQQEGLDWINGNCTLPQAGQYSCTYNAGIFVNGTPNCSIQTIGQNVYTVVESNTPGGIIYGTFQVNNVRGSSAVYLTCTKSGTDFKPRQTIQGFFSSMLSGVAFAANHSTGQVITSGSTSQVIFNIEAYDTNNTYNPATGTYLIPEAGRYKCHCRVGYAAMTPSSPSTLTSAIFKNGGLVSETYLTLATVGNLYMPTTHGSESFVAGDAITCGSLQNTGVNRALSTTTAHSEFSCEKVAN